MKFKMEMSGNNKGYGRLCCTVPDEMESAILFKDFEAFCRKKAKEKFGNYRAITERLDKELNFIKETDSVIFFEILREIAKLSAGEGYPVSLEGEESGSLILYLFGVSGIHPGEYEFRQTPTDLFIETARKRGELSLSLGIAESIRNLIVPRLTKEFGYIKSGENDWFKIDISSWEMLDEIGKLSKLTGVHYSKVPVDDYLLTAVQSWDICEPDLEWENTSEDYCESITPLSVAKHYAFARCNCNTDKTPAAFSDMQKYIFRDDLYEAFTQAGLPSQKAYLLSRNWLNGEDKEKETEMLKEYNLPLNAVYVFKELYNQWSIATCLSRVNAMVLLRYYEFNYPKEFEELDYEVTGIIPTGFEKLDKILEGGFRKGDLCLIGSRPAMGKTSFAIQLASSFAKSRKKVLLFSLESPDYQVKERMAKQGNEDAPIIIDDTSAVTPNYIRERIESEKADVAVIDYFGLIEASEKKGTRVEEVSDIAYELRKIAEELNVAIVVTMQLSRDYGKQINELKYKCTLEGIGFGDQDANTILFLNRDNYYSNDRNSCSNSAQIIVAKNAYGNIGRIDATFDSAKQLFKEV